MKNSSVFTTSLPNDLVGLLSQYAEKFNVPKNKILEEALKLYFDRLKKAEYIRSFKKAASSKELQSLAEEGLADYLKILEE
jgi:predicted transcriptional regulator